MSITCQCNKDRVAERKWFINQAERKWLINHWSCEELISHFVAQFYCMIESYFNLATAKICLFLNENKCLESPKDFSG